MSFESYNTGAPAATTGLVDRHSTASVNLSIEDIWLGSVLSGIRWCFLPIVFAGTITNCLNFVVLSHKEMRSCSTGVYLCAVAIADLGVMYFELFRVWFEWIVPPQVYFTDVYCKLANYMNGVVRDYSNWLIACLTLERVVMMTCPYLARTLCTVKRAHRIVFILLIVICIPHIYTLVFSKAQKNIGWVCWEDPDSRVGHILAALVDFVVGYVVVIVVFILNLIMIFIIYRHHIPIREGDAPATSATHRWTVNRRLTRTLLIVAVVFLVCETPRMITSFICKFIKRTPTLRIILNASFVLSGINHAANFFIYIIASPRFRQLFLAMVPCRLSRRSATATAEAATRQRGTAKVKEQEKGLASAAGKDDDADKNVAAASNSKDIYVQINLQVFVSAANEVASH